MSAYAYKYSRLTDNDRHFGPITLGERSDTWRPISLSVASGDDEHPGAYIMVRAFGWSVRIAVPAVIKPWREWRDTSRLFPNEKNSGYWAIHRREFGFCFSEGYLHLDYGPQTHDSQTTKSKCIALPWKQWRHVRYSFYDLSGAHWWTEPKPCKWDDMDRMRQACPTVTFEIEDYDGQRIRATTRIEEREWRFGEKWCSWLSIFRRPKIRRSLDISFDKEVGTEKGSWKGGLMGTGIEMLAGELHEAAFRRFCAQPIRNKYDPSQIKFIGRAA